jgi:hypothetical protein
MFDNLYYCNIDYFSYTYKDNKVIWMKLEDSMVSMNNFM